MKRPTKLLTQRNIGWVLGGIALILGLCTFSLVSPKLPLWNLLTTLSIGMVGVVSILWARAFPRLATVLAICASALTPIATPAAWFLLFQIGLRQRFRTAIFFGIGSLLGNGVLLTLFLFRWARPDMVGTSVLIGLFASVISLGATALGVGVRVHREREALATARLDEAVRRETHAIAQSLAQERERVARDMHDHLGHRLALLNIYAASLAHLSSLTAEESAEVTTAVRAQVRDVIDALSASLREPEETEDARPIEAMHQLIGDVRSAGFDVQFDVAGDLEQLDGRRSRLLVRFCREGLTNALKYSAGKRMTVRIAEEPAGLSASITSMLTDRADGISAHTASRIGIASLQQDASRLDGDVTLTLSPMEARLDLRIPAEV